MSKPFLKIAALLVFPVMILYALVLVPSFEIIASDIMLMNTLLLDAVDLLMQWAEIFALILIMAFLLVGTLHTESLLDCKPLFYLLGGALLLKYVGAILALSVVHGSFDTTLDYGSYLVSLLLELLPCLVLVWLTWRQKTAQAAQKNAFKRAAAVLGEALEDKENLPFTALFDRQNPLQRIAYIALGIFSTLRIIAFVASEIAYTMLGFSFTVTDLLITLLYFFLLILLPCFIGYFVFYFTVKFACKRI